jgi:hypothetical protein
MTTIKANGRDLELKTDQDIALYPTNNIWISQGTKLIFEGTVPDDYEVKLQATSVTADRDIILPDASGTMATQEWASSQFTSQPVANISGATQANPVVITTAAAHNFTNGASVTITDVVGMTELNSNSYYVSVLTSTTAALYSDAGLTTGVDGTAFTAYVSDGVATQSLTASTDFNTLLNKPTTIAGYGITDPIVLSDSSVAAQPIRQYYANQAAFPSATDWHGAIAHSHSDGAMYFAHGGVWNKLTNDADAFDGDYNNLTNKPTIPAAYTDSDVNTHLNQSTATSNTVLSWDGADYTWVAQTTGYGDANVNTHLNQSTATANQILSWSGGDYDWIDQSSFQNVVDDTTPELGGDLNMNGNDIIGTGNINITGSVTSTAVGVPTITSSTDINFTAGTGATDRVEVTQSPFKIASFTTTQRDAKTSEDGDLIYNSSNNQFELYTNTSWAAMTKVVYDNLLPSSDFVDQITNIWSANPTTPADFATWAQTIASDGYEYGNIDLSTTPPTIRSADSLAWLNISTNNSPDPAHVTRWLDIVLPSLIEQSWFDVHTSNLVNGNVFSRVSDDATPKLGGALDADGKNIENLGQVQIGQLGSVVFEGSTDDAFETTLTVVDPTADRTIFFPDATGFVALLGSTQDFTASQTFSSDLVVGSVLKVEGSIWEEYIAGTVTTNTLTVDILGSANTTQTVSGLSANFEVAFTNAPTSGTYTIGVALIITQGASAYIPNTCTVNGTTVSIKWLNASAPTGNANQKDVVNFTLVNNSGTYDVLASLSTFG